MTFLQIKYLIAVGSTGNVSKAASELYVSRPTISRALRELEEEFGFPLFYRTNSGLLLTEEGKFFYEKCLELQNLTSQLSAQMRLRGESRGPSANSTIRLGVTPSTSLSIFPQMFRLLRELRPELRIQTLDLSRLRARAALADGSLDFNLSADARSETLPKDIERLELVKTQLVLLMRPDHRLAGREFVTIDDIKDEPLIYLAKYFQNEESVDRLYQQRGFTPNIKFRSLQMSTIRRLVEDGLGCAILMQGIIDDGKKIVSVPFKPAFPNTICLTWNSAVPHKKSFYEFIEFARVFQKELNAGGGRRVGG
ncbi:MAG: LysR family transcriptional regulator [Oscillospiraceae bacterium]|nr:LysR family transcriptional regulator [Oscillospiraceae bacterium]